MFNLRRNARGSVLIMAMIMVTLLAALTLAFATRISSNEGRMEVDIAATYAANGAACLSVLTDRLFFQGGLDILQAVRHHVDLPLLRKDFILDPYQVLEARLAGADAVLLIAECLPESDLTRLFDAVCQLQMTPLVELYEPRHLNRVLESGARLIGINNRDLSTFHVDLAVSERLIPRIGALALAISESGFQTHQDVIRAAGAGAKGVLIGSAFCSSPDVRSKVIEVMGA